MKIETGNVHFDSWFRKTSVGFKRLTGIEIDRRSPDSIFSAFMRNLTPEEAAKELSAWVPLDQKPAKARLKPATVPRSLGPVPDGPCRVIISSPYFSESLQLDFALREIAEAKLEGICAELRKSGVREYHLSVLPPEEEEDEEVKD